MLRNLNGFFGFWIRDTAAIKRDEEMLKATQLLERMEAAAAKKGLQVDPRLATWDFVSPEAITREYLEQVASLVSAA